MHASDCQFCLPLVIILIVSWCSSRYCYSSVNIFFIIVDVYDRYFHKYQGAALHERNKERPIC